jgi:hypothetical protein
MPYAEITKNMKAKDLKALTGRVATLGRITDDDTARADEALVGMPSAVSEARRPRLSSDRAKGGDLSSRSPSAGSSRQRNGGGCASRSIRWNS